MNKKMLVKNKKAFFDYFIEETCEAGIVLVGTEIKSLKSGRTNIKDAFATIRNGEVWLHNMHISTYEFGNRFNHEETRVRKLLLHRSEINKLIGLTKEKGYTLVPIEVYLINGKAKVLVGLGKGKKNYDKREDLKKKDSNREIERVLKERQYN